MWTNLGKNYTIVILWFSWFFLSSPNLSDVSPSHLTTNIIVLNPQPPSTMTKFAGPQVKTHQRRVRGRGVECGVKKGSAVGE
ncbi:hypothetical protein B0I73DRAFT_20165 [Yarrowia lipolytica]|jgi:hypothetical protein|uniref:Uncharacterized protein n=1 Tax=Yarrowia lipolytica TaxID=4952 RepID=A0A371CCB6_YARLL|nr:hypothetical protein BKA91DRAFT_39309 [Yarrowia lipolytica]KAE8174953.1 hypothetical protein BKA90DRAFT_21728 [Yarrowia lipolytica]RDW27951.1 hypothetical protein B0I71DRAFT_11492 [Yarrowia lipolytica]RDW36372.1 hypothetical protein B0I73DRAFT_20165 [Yarrowia lipolytica]RDW47834.1 hypothetical protein B0I74DRAFT_9590 [Yarrowia lipolytica]